ncbi:D-alanyl-D-alanine carboxypeptidase [Streptomyces sp. NPDC057702]|uniref:D-alanyl-D-alanine carboxypeptidase n=1 Tax=unclassified Streptomyces TaxID=2593676 RepID=UPI00369F0ABE
MCGTPAARHARAKTGSLTGGSALSGYVTDAGGHELAHGIPLNHHLVPSVKDIEDALAVPLATTDTGRVTGARPTRRHPPAAPANPRSAPTTPPPPSGAPGANPCAADGLHAPPRRARRAHAPRGAPGTRATPPRAPYAVPPRTPSYSTPRESSSRMSNELRFEEELTPSSFGKGGLFVRTSGQPFPFFARQTR